MRISSASLLGFVSILLVIISILGLIFLSLYYTIRGPYGTWNDVCNSLVGILSGILATLFYPSHRAYTPKISSIALLIALIGMSLTVLGSWLIIRDVTGWVLAGLVSTLGFALLGSWLLTFNISMRHLNHFPKRLAQFGIIASIIMMIGFFSIPGIITRTDSIYTASWLVMIGLIIGGLGWTIFYTIWCLWLGQLLLSKRHNK